VITIHEMATLVSLPHRESAPCPAAEGNNSWWGWPRCVEMTPCRDGYGVDDKEMTPRLFVESLVLFLSLVISSNIALFWGTL